MTKLKLEVNFIPSEGKVLLKEKAEGKSKGGIILDKAKEETSMTAKGLIWKSSVEGINPGDTVIYNRHAVMGIILDEGKYLITSREAIIGTIPAK